MAITNTIEDVATDIEDATATIGSTTVSLSALITQLGKIATENLPDAILSSHVSSVKSLLLSKQFETDLVDVADLLGLLGLVVPPIAVAANDLHEFATALIVAHALFSGALSVMHLFANLVPDGRGGYVSQAWANDPREQLDPDGTFKD